MQVSKLRGLSASVSFLPLPLPPLSFFDSRFISRVAKTGLSLLRNQMETLAMQATLMQEVTLHFLFDASQWHAI